MKCGDLVKTTLIGLDKPARDVLGLLIKPLATYYWSVFLLEEETYICLPLEAFEVISASR
tara:strand:- start:15959 stop:16138 length:180 start_codon:yes stop_codon:yes gene_type:complete